MRHHHALRRSTRYRLIREADQRRRTKAIFAESVGNPLGNITDIAALAELAHRHGLPLIVDNTVPSPYLLRPIEHGADIVVQSLTKYLGGHGTSLGGAIIDSGKFLGRAQGPLQAPERTRHQLSRGGLCRAFGPAAYIGRARVVPLRNTGAAISPFNSFQILRGIETLALRVDRIVENAVKVAGFLREHPKVEWVNYAGLPDHPDHALVRKYLGGKAPGLFTFGVKGGREDRRALPGRAAAVHPPGQHRRRQVAGHAPGVHHAPPAQSRRAAKAGVREETVRLSIGIEHIDDLIADLDQALAQV